MKFLNRKDGKMKKLRGGEDEEVTIRTRVREIIEGKFVTTLMTLVTLFALFGDDFRLWFFGSWVDPYQYSILILCFFLFAIEILLNSCVVDDFKYAQSQSLFFLICLKGFEVCFLFQQFYYNYNGAYYRVLIFLLARHCSNFKFSNRYCLDYRLD